MLRLTQAPDIAMATLWRDLLCEAGMPASVQRQHLGAAAGHLPPGECLPEIWLTYPEHAERARALLRESSIYRSASGAATRAVRRSRAASSSAGIAAP